MIFDENNDLNEMSFKLDKIKKLEDFRFEFEDVIYEIANLGGYLALTKNFNNSLEKNKNSFLSKNIVIIDSKGLIYQKIFINSKIITISFDENENLLILLDKGELIFGTLLNGKTKYYMVLNKDILNEDPIVKAKINNNSILFLTKSNKFYFCPDYWEFNSYLFEECLNPLNEEFKFKFDFNLYDNMFNIFYLIEEEGVCFKKFNNINKEFEDKIIIINSNTNTIIDLKLNLDGNYLALVNKEYKVIIIKLNKGNNIEFKININLENKYIDIFWIEDCSLLIQFDNKILILCRNECFELENDFYFGEDSLILIKSEVDGIKIININSKSSSGFIYYYRRKTIEYEKCTDLISLEPGAILYQTYKEFTKSKPLDDEDIRNKKDILENGINDWIEAIKFELKPKKQIKMLKSIAFGKLFLKSQTNWLLNIIKKLSEELKIINNINDILNRTLTYSQYTSINIEKLFDILINYNKFNLIFNIINLQQSKNQYKKKYFLIYINKLIENNNDKKIIAQRILNFLYMYFEKNEYELLIKQICEECIKYKDMELIEILLDQVDNPSIKIPIFLNSNNYSKSIKESKNYFSSQLLYSVFKKFIDNSSIKEKSNFYNVIIKNKLKFESFHLVNYLYKTNNNSDMKEFINNVKGFKKYLIFYYKLINIYTLKNDKNMTLFEKKFNLIKNLSNIKSKKKINNTITDRLLKCSTKLLNNSDEENSFNNIKNISLTQLIEFQYTIYKKTNSLSKILSFFDSFLKNKDIIIYKFISLSIKANDWALAYTIVEESIKLKISLKAKNIYFIFELNNQVNNVFNIIKILNFKDSYNFCYDNYVCYLGFLLCKHHNKLDKIKELRKIATKEDLLKFD